MLVVSYEGYPRNRSLRGCFGFAFLVLVLVDDVVDVDADSDVDADLSISLLIDSSGPYCRGDEWKHSHVVVSSTIKVNVNVKGDKESGALASKSCRTTTTIMTIPAILVWTRVLRLFVSHFLLHTSNHVFSG